MQKVMVDSQCPECTAEGSFDADARIGEIVECRECRSELEVSSIEPFVLSLAPEVEEDWGE